MIDFGIALTIGGSLMTGVLWWFIDWKVALDRWRSKIINDEGGFVTGASCKDSQAACRVKPHLAVLEQWKDNASIHGGGFMTRIEHTQTCVAVVDQILERQKEASIQQIRLVQLEMKNEILQAIQKLATKI